MMDWLEDDDFQPRSDVLAEDLSADSRRLPVAYPSRFRPGDIVRIGEDDVYDTGKVDEDGEPIFRVWNETVRVIDVDRGVTIVREVGANQRRSVPRGQPVMIIGTGFNG